MERNEEVVLLEMSIEEYGKIEERIKSNAETAEEFNVFNKQALEWIQMQGVENVGSAMQVQSQIIRLSDYSDQQHIALAEIKRQHMSAKIELAELNKK